MRTLFAVLYTAGITLAQSVFEIRVEKATFYAEDTFDYARLGAEAGPVTAQTARNFDRFIGIGDITAINGQPAKGIWVTRVQTLVVSPTAEPGQAIGDIGLGSLLEWHFQILTSDGTQVGAIYAKGIPTGNPPALGTPSAARLSLAIIGGNGAYLGARGQVGFAAGAALNPPTSGGNASMREDPSRRRVQPREYMRSFVVHLIDTAFRPEVLATASGPAVVHASDSSLVTAAKPARPGEVLSLYASGLGPTKTSLMPGQPFPSNPLAVVNSPVDVLAGGLRSEVLYAGGYPGATDRYQVNFRLPSGVAPGNVALQLVMGYMPGPAVTLPVQ